MYRRSYSCLLLPALLVPAQLLLFGQTGRSNLVSPTAQDVSASSTQFAHARPVPVPEPIQVAPVRPPSTIGFREMVRAAGMIFSGTVTSIEPHPSQNAHSLETVGITFRVGRAIRGTIPGESLTISQWVALWSQGQNYRVGQHILLFLYPPSKLGLTSCVAGPMGRFEINAAERVLLSPRQRALFRDNPVLSRKSSVQFGAFSLAVRRAEAEQSSSRGDHAN